MQKEYQNAITIIENYKKYLRNAQYVNSMSASTEGGYTLRISNNLDRMKARKQEFEIALMVEILKNPSILEENAGGVDLVKEISSLKFEECLDLAKPTELSTRQAYELATDVLAEYTKHIDCMFKLDKMVSMSYTGNHPEVIAESHQIHKQLSKQSSTMTLLKLMKQNPEILTIQDVNGNNIGMECARLLLSECAEYAKTNKEAALQRNELGLTIDDTIELTKPKAYRKPSMRDRELTV